MLCMKFVCINVSKQKGSLLDVADKLAYIEGCQALNKKISVGLMFFLSVCDMRYVFCLLSFIYFADAVSYKFLDMHRMNLEFSLSA